MKTGIILCSTIGMLFAGCVTHNFEPALQLGNFPSIRFLAPEQANRVTVDPKAVRTGDLSQDDWHAIIAIISRLAELSDNDRMIVSVTCFGNPTIAVTIQLGYGCYVIQFVKTDETAWKVAAIYRVVA